MSIRSKTGEPILEAAGKISNAPIQVEENELYELDDFVDVLQRPTPPHSNNSTPNRGVVDVRDPVLDPSPVIVGRDPNQVEMEDQIRRDSIHRESHSQIRRDSHNQVPRRDSRNQVRPGAMLSNPLLVEPKKLVHELSPRAIDADLEPLLHEIQQLRKRVIIL